VILQLEWSIFNKKIIFSGILPLNWIKWSFFISYKSHRSSTINSNQFPYSYTQEECKLHRIDGMRLHHFDSLINLSQKTQFILAPILKNTPDIFILIWLWSLLRACAYRLGCEKRLLFWLYPEGYADSKNILGNLLKTVSSESLYIFLEYRRCTRFFGTDQ